MSTAKIIEIIAESPHSFEDAIKQGIAETAKSVRNIKGAWIQEQKITIDNNKIISFRVDLKVTFIHEA